MKNNLGPYFICFQTRGGGHSTFFQVGVCGPDFRSVGLANWHLPLKRGACERKTSKFRGLWAENFQIWGLVSWKFPNLGACELQFGWKLRLYRLKFPNFLKRGSCELTLLLEMDPCERQERREKGVFRAAHPHTPFLGQCPPGFQTIIFQKQVHEVWPGGHWPRKWVRGCAALTTLFTPLLKFARVPFQAKVPFKRPLFEKIWKF